MSGTDENKVDIPILSAGIVLGGLASDLAWDAAATKVAKRITEKRSGYISPLNVNVIFYIPGSITSPDFTGVRTGRYSSSKSLLVVQVSVPEHPALSAENEIRDLLYAAIDEAESFARRKNIADDLVSLRQLLTVL